MTKRLAILYGGLLSAPATLFLAGGARQSPASAVGTSQSVVSTTEAGNGWAVNYPKQRKLFVMAGLIWAFYSDGVNGVYRTSREGSRWSEPTTFGPGGHYGHRFGCWFDGRFLHYCLCTAALGADVQYRRGGPNADGTLTWSAPQQVAFDTPADRNVMYPKLIVDSAGHPWITFLQLVYAVPNAPPYDAIVIRSSTDDGTWETDAGFPFHLVHQKTVAGYPDAVGAPLTHGKTFWFYNDHVDGEDVFVARIWTRSGWGEPEIVVHPASEYSFFNAVADRDDVHVIHGAGTIRYQKRAWGSGWSEPFPVDKSASGHTSLSLLGPDRVAATWLDTSQQALRYREVNRGKWEPAVTWVDESVAGLAGAGINSNALVNSGGRFEHAAIYSTGNAARFEIKFAAVRRQR